MTFRNNDYIYPQNCFKCNPCSDFTVKVHKLIWKIKITVEALK